MRQGIVPLRRDQHGFTLVEVMVAALVLMIGVIGTFVMIDGANQTTRQNNARTAASAIAREVLEHARTIEYTDVSPSRLVAELREKPEIQGTTDANGNWLLRQRNVNVTVQASVCTYDDPSDGRGDGTVPLADACPAGADGAGGATTTDSNPDDFRRVTLTLTWRDPDAATLRRITQTAQINNPSGGLGPRIITFPNPFASAQVTSGTSIPFVATSTYANNVTWTADDGRTQGRGELSGGGEAWSWNWPIGTVDVGTPRTDWVVDGAYTINAQPFDSRGVPGELRVASVWLNRRLPLTPRRFLGGRSGLGGGSEHFVEMDWLTSIERDVIGYRVYRTTDNARICPATTGAHDVTTALSCTDTNPPSGSGLRYKLVAVDREDIKNPVSATREGDPAYIDVSASVNTRLPAPTNLTSTTTLAQKPQLDWTAPAVPAGQGIHFYRVYRDGVRYGRTSGPFPQFVDPAPTSSSHSYQVSAVHDPTYNEGHLSTARIWTNGG